MIQKKRDRIFVVGGGTGGHLFPAMALGQELAARNYKVYLITDPRCTKYLNNNIGLKLKIIKSQSIKSGAFSKFRAMLFMLIGVVESFTFLLRTRPKVVVGFGGYAMLPMVFAAKLLRIPIILHEQNAFLGKANSFFAEDAKAIALTFKDTTNIPDSCKDKLVATGNPVRKEIKKLNIVRSYKDINTLNILIFGGSQGAKFFANLIPNSIKIINKSAPNLKLRITQQVSKSDWARLKRAYRKFGIEFELADFFYDIHERYQHNHLAICRAGASTISEFIAVQLPAIYIPFPSAANNHQLLNAQYIERNKAGWYFEQHCITPEMLAGKIIELAQNTKLLEKAAINLKQLQQETETIFADTVERIIRG